MPHIHIELQPYKTSFEVLSQDLRRLLQYVEPADQNLNTYSHRIFELLLRSCTEFESLCKEILITSGYAKTPNDMNIHDYVELEKLIPLSEYKIIVSFWAQTPRHFTPFDGWTTTKPPLSWYRDYNKAKHNRNTEFTRANLSNLMGAYCAVFEILACQYAFSDAGGGGSYARGNGIYEINWPGQSLSLLGPPFHTWLNKK